jgi:hypothetical protein
VTETQIGIYMAKSGLHIPLEKVPYSYFDQTTHETLQIRRKGWLIGGEGACRDDISKRPSVQREFNLMFDDDAVVETGDVIVEKTDGTNATEPMSESDDEIMALFK